MDGDIIGAIVCVGWLSIFIGVLLFVLFRKIYYKDKFKKYDFVQEYVKKGSEVLIEQIQFQKRDSHTKFVSTSIKIRVDSDGIGGFLGGGYDFNEYNKKPLGIIQRSAMREILVKMILKNVKEYLAKNPVDRKYRLFYWWIDKEITYEASNPSYVPPKSW